jgi:hypothetical protein
MGMYLKYLNKKQAQKRVAMGLPADLKDMSIMTQEDAAKYRAELISKLADQGTDEARLFENAFEDMTDFQ